MEISRCRVSCKRGPKCRQLQIISIHVVDFIAEKSFEISEGYGCVIPPREQEGGEKNISGGRGINNRVGPCCFLTPKERHVA